MKSTSQRTDKTISLHLNEAGGNPDAGALAALVLLQRKGRVLDAMTRTFATVRERIADPGHRNLLDQLNTTTAQLARMVLGAPEEVSRTSSGGRFADLEARKERLESALSERDAEFRAQTQPVTLQAVQAAIPGEGALIEYVVYRPYDPRIDGDDAYGAPHYAAYVMRKSGAPRGVDLGPASAIDDAVEMLREALRDPKRRDVTTRARAVDEQIFRASATVPWRRNTTARLAGRRSQSRAIRCARGRGRPVPGRTVRDELSHEWSRSLEDGSEARERQPAACHRRSTFRRAS